MHDHDDVMSGSENHNPNANWMFQWKARDIMYKYSSSSASLTESSYRVEAFERESAAGSADVWRGKFP